MNEYTKMKDRIQKEVNNFPMFFAFNNKQFTEGMEKLGLKPNETDKIYSCGNTGGYYRKTDAKILHEMFDRHDKELTAALQDPAFAYDAFNYELGNHEYVITYNTSDTISALGLTAEQVNNSTVLNEALEKACKAQKEWYMNN